MKTTCGIFLLNNKNELLVTHATNSSWERWSIPKGIPEKNETYLIAAKREFLEETNIDLDKYEYSMLALGCRVYPNNNKILFAFVFKIDDEITEEIKCNSMVYMEGKEPFPENDFTEWITIDRALDILHVTQISLLQNNLNKIKRYFITEIIIN